MRFVNSSTRERLREVTVLLKREEAQQLLVSLQDLLEGSAGHHVHVSDGEFRQELTLSLYSSQNLDSFDPASRRIILEPD